MALIGLSASLNDHLFCGFRPTTRGGGMAISSLTAIAVCAATYTLPRIEPFWMSKRIAEVVERHEGDQPRRFVSVGYRESSLVFAMGTETITYKEAARLAAGDEKLVFAINERWRAAYENQTAGNGHRLRPGASVSVSTTPWAAGSTCGSISHESDSVRIQEKHWWESGFVMIELAVWQAWPAKAQPVSSPPLGLGSRCRRHGAAVIALPPLSPRASSYEQ